MPNPRRTSAQPLAQPFTPPRTQQPHRRTRQQHQQQTHVVNEKNHDPAADYTVFTKAGGAEPKFDAAFPSRKELLLAAAGRT
jgi:hypothetical protein